MEPFIEHEGLVATLDRANVDTDQIIPKQFMKSIRRTGFGENLFYDWRYLPDGSLNPDFELNAPRFKGASILVARANFGCGSSREHAVWAILQYGFRAVIAPHRDTETGRLPAFADIFRNNAMKNGLLPIELSEAEVEEIFRAVARREGLRARISLPEQTVTLLDQPPRRYHFEIEPSAKEMLLKGLDEIGLTLAQEDAIAAFERRHDPQLYGTG
jgi:3-isopropylmalate/(R)-2-methylmalate dehydratase small subunit